MEDKTLESVELLKKCDSKSVINVLHKMVDGLCLKTRPSYNDYSKIWSLQEWWELLEVCTDIFKEAVKEVWDKDKLFQTLGELSEDYKAALFDVINSRQIDIRHQLLADTHAISQAVLTDFDWKVKLVMSSDKISTVQEPVVAVDVNVTGNSGTDTVSVELNREELKNLINSLEAANKALIQLKS